MSHSYWQRGQHSKTLAAALAQGSLGIESLQGGSNLSYKLSQVRECMCLAHCFMDHDAAGLQAVKKAEQEGLLILADASLTVCNGMKESEIEDLYEEALYTGMLMQKYGVSTKSPKFGGRAKWSNRLAEAFKHQGKPWSDEIKARVKFDVATLAESQPATALNAHKRACFDALVQAVEGKLTIIAAGKK